MDWSKGFSARYYATIVDPVTWRDVTNFDIIDGSIKISDDILKESADIRVLNYDTSKEQWIRIWLDARQNDSSYHGALFTGLATSPSFTINGNTFENNLQCYSVLKPANDILLPRGWFASAGVNVASTIEELLDPIPAPIEVDDNPPLLSNTIIAEDNETNLSMVNKLLIAMNWRLRISGEGKVRICPMPDALSAAFDSVEQDLLELTVQVENDWYKCPNVFRAVDDNSMAIARDDDEESPFSTVNRGREIWMEETGCVFNHGETLAEYADRRLKEEQDSYYKLSYTRRYHPDVKTTDLISLHYPAQGLEGVFTVTSQSISLGYGASVSETVNAI